MSELENRVPEITSLGPLEVEENRRRVGQLEAVDWDEEDEVIGYAIAGGADGGLFRVEAETGELSFKEAPDYENPADVESEDPESGAGDNEYIVVIAVTSGEGERERTREQAMRVRVTDVEMEEATEDGMEEETESLFVPVILSSAGRNNSFFTSELTLTNRGEQEVALDYTYTSRDEPQARSGRASEVLPAGRQKIATDALGYLRDLGIPIPETGNQLGTLRVEAPLGSEVEAMVRTTTLVPDGRAGLAYLGIAEEEGFDEPVYLCGLRQNSRDRSNVAIQNMGNTGEGAITLKTTVYSGEASDTSPRELDDITLGPGGFHQYSGLLGGLENGYVKVERVEGEAPFYAYGVINDQANSDGSFVISVRARSLEGKRAQTLPVIVETRDFTSELTVTNFSEEPRTLNLEFVSEQIQGDDKRVEFSMDLAAGEQAIVPELVEALRREERAKLGGEQALLPGAAVRQGGRGRPERGGDRGPDELAGRGRPVRGLLQRGSGRRGLREGGLGGGIAAERGEPQQPGAGEHGRGGREPERLPPGDLQRGDGDAGGDGGDEGDFGAGLAPDRRDSAESRSGDEAGVHPDREGIRAEPVSGLRSGQRWRRPGATERRRGLPAGRRVGNARDRPGERDVDEGTRRTAKGHLASQKFPIFETCRSFFVPHSSCSRNRFPHSKWDRSARRWVMCVFRSA